MYLLIVILLMFVLPVISIGAEMFLFHSPLGILALIGRWFVFWVAGIRQGSAGLRQTLNPQFTAKEILGLEGEKNLIVVQELGMANLSIGVLGILTLLNTAWVEPAAVVGGLYLGLAGIRHIFTARRNLMENVAMVSDLVASAVLLLYVCLTLLG